MKTINKLLNEMRFSIVLILVKVCLFLAEKCFNLLIIARTLLFCSLVIKIVVKCNLLSTCSVFPGDAPVLKLTGLGLSLSPLKRQHP
ncbi:MAG: hypothetical protein ACI8R9_000475 [Paraglaciecola sp.]|jgi:hypothetical protein